MPALLQTLSMGFRRQRFHHPLPSMLHGSGFYHDGTSTLITAGIEHAVAALAFTMTGLPPVRRRYPTLGMPRIKLCPLGSPKTRKKIRLIPSSKMHKIETKSC
ncbi:MAG: hypothetical protein E3K40_05465 [Candidatus Brocadia sp.]|nr:hypothetical protein [Candidatus Brocadia sp.]